MSVGVTSGLFARLRAVWRGLSRRAQLDRDMDDEMRFHIEMQAERLAREQQLDPQEACRRAYVAFGGVEKYKEAGRDTRGVGWLDAIAVDYRLGVRMLVKYPSLTLIGGFAMAVAIAIGAIAFEAITEVLDPALPIEGGDRVVALQYQTDRQGSPERRLLHDFMAWRGELRSVRELGAYRTVERNLLVGDRHPEVIRVAEITASGFELARTPPLMGRYLLAADEHEGAPQVVVIGYRAWQSRFGGDPAIVGRTITLGASSSVIVGVMPDGYEFPINHQYWTPLRANPAAFPRWQGPALNVFGRLAPGVSMATAQAELSTIGEQAAATYPEPARRLRLVALPYTREYADIDRPEIVWMLRVAQLLIAGLLVVVSVNLSILVYARTVMRLTEIAVRSALGASRGRILAQLFMEAFALSLVGAAAGLLLADLGLGWLQAMMAPVAHLPFWLTFNLSASTVGYALALAVLAAAIVGVLPGLKTTGRRLNDHLRESSAGAGTRLGPMWTTLIVVQVAIAVAVLPLALYIVTEVARMEFTPPAFPADEYVLAEVDMTADQQLELIARLEAEPSVRAVTSSIAIPGFEGSRRLAFDDATGARSADTFDVNVTDVAPNIFEVYEARLIAGRTFTPGDTGGDGVVVNHAFAQRFVDHQPTVGRRFSMRRGESLSAGTWDTYQIVGIVDDFPAFPPQPGSDGVATVYHPAAPGSLRSPVLTVRFNGRAPSDFVGRLRQAGADVDAALPLSDVMLLTEFYSQNRAVWRLISWALAFITASVVLLSAGGMYALLSFTVAQRTREIGIRTALGAHPRRILLSVFGRVLRQISIGLIVGSAISGALLSGSDLGLRYAGSLVLGVSAVILIVGIAAAMGPARRSLRVQATEALRAQ